MRYYLGQCDFKWKHAHGNLEPIWIRRELGDELYKTIESNNWTWKLVHSKSQTLPDDIYCRCDIYVDTNDDKLDTHFVLKYPQAKQLEEII